MIWKPNVTVASVIESDGKFLLVEEHTPEGILYNQPAGHLEPGESLMEGAIRETLEESGYGFEPRAVVGIYQWRKRDTTYLRFAFAGRITHHEPERNLDEGIIAAHWLTPGEIRKDRLRSPMVWRAMEDFLSGMRYPLDIITTWR